MSGLLARGFFLVSIVLLSVWPMLVGHRIAFRDASHFYLPLYDYVADRTADEWMPLWNPLDQGGMPLIGESSTAVLYPIRYAVYSLPLDSAAKLNAYIAVHLLLAAMGAWWLATQWGATHAGALIAALSYPLSGSVYSLCCNPPFLVGASWIPFAIGICRLKPSQDTSRRDSSRRIAGFGSVIALMVLGGDPQSALNVVLVVMSVVVVRLVAKLVGRRQHHRQVDDDIGSERLSIGNRPQPRDSRLNPGFGDAIAMVRLLAFGSLLAAGLASIQIAAALDWSAQSERIGRSFRSECYEFSLPPWHSVEILTARPYGHPFPINRRVSSLIPGDGRMWTPSLYAGLLLGFAFFCRLVRPKTWTSDLWFPLAALSLLLSFGHFGMVWIGQQVPGVLRDSNSAIGGAYWILCSVVPGYDAFRYPVKWLPFFALACSMIAARWSCTRPARLESVLATVLGSTLLVIAAVISITISPSGDKPSTEIPTTTVADEYWGPLDYSGGMTIARNSCLWSVVVLTGITLLRRQLWTRMRPASVGDTSRINLRRWQFTLVLLTAADCLISASTLLPWVNIEQTQKLANQASPSQIQGLRTLRTQDGNWPSNWRQTSSPDRATEVAASERLAWFGRWHLAEHRSVFNGMVSIRSRRHAQFWESVKYHSHAMTDAEYLEFWNRLKKWLAIDSVSHTDGDQFVAAGGHALVSCQRFSVPDSESLRLHLDWLPETEVDEVVRRIAIDQDFALPTVAAAPPDTATAETKPVQENTAPPAIMNRAGQSEVEVRSESSCLLERCVYQDGNWVARVNSVDANLSHEIPVYRCGGLNQAVRLPAGHWNVRFEYRPWWLRLTLAITAVSLVVLIRLTWGIVVRENPR